ncbi:MAG TPA: hypothetical protein VGK23_01330 [Methanomassiliicoccales archaeon]
MSIIPPNVSASSGSTSPEIVQVSVYVQDFNEFSVTDGTIKASFYLTLRSDTNVTIDDIDIINGHATSVETILNQTNMKEYRIIADLTADPDLRRFPFDRHIIPIEIEPRYKNEQQMVLIVGQVDTGLDSDAGLPGWELKNGSSAIVNKTYIPGEIPFSRAVFTFGIERDATSTILKFFLPIMLIIVVALSSLMIKISSRLGLNASMFLAAVLIHWRIADAIPVVAYATFLDLFMIITYATLVMVLVSGLLILRSTEAKDQERISLVNKWSVRIIPTISLSLYCLLFVSLLVQ